MELNEVMQNVKLIMDAMDVGVTKEIEIEIPIHVSSGKPLISSFADAQARVKFKVPVTSEFKYQGM